MVEFPARIKCDELVKVVPDAIPVVLSIAPVVPFKTKGDSNVAGEVPGLSLNSPPEIIVVPVNVKAELVKVNVPRPLFTRAVIMIPGILPLVIAPEYVVEVPSVPAVNVEVPIVLLVILPGPVNDPVLRLKPARFRVPLTMLSKPEMY